MSVKGFGNTGICGNIGSHTHVQSCVMFRAAFMMGKEWRQPQASFADWLTKADCINTKEQQARAALLSSHSTDFLGTSTSVLQHESDHYYHENILRGETH